METRKREEQGVQVAAGKRAILCIQIVNSILAIESCWPKAADFSTFGRSHNFACTEGLQGVSLKNKHVLSLILKERESAALTLG